MSAQSREWMMRLLPPIVTGLVTAGGMLVAYGNNTATLNEVKTSVERHHYIDTPKEIEKIESLQTQATTNRTNIENIQRSLEEIKQQNERILLRLSTHNKQ